MPLQWRNQLWQSLEKGSPFVQEHGPEIVLQQDQDDARHHVASVVLNELEVRNIDTLPWPAIS